MTIYTMSQSRRHNGATLIQKLRCLSVETIIIYCRALFHYIFGSVYT